MTLSVCKKLIYGLGQFGIILVSYGVVSYFSEFYVVQSGLSYPQYIWQGYVWGLFTIVGFIIAIGKLFDAGAGLFLGWISDKSELKKGRRTGLMAIAFIPLVFCSVLVFFPPSSSFVINTIYLFIFSLFFYFFLTLYVTPYLALLSELGTGARDRMHLSTLMACATAFASLFGNFGFNSLENISSYFGCSRLEAFRLLIVFFSLISSICLVLPVYFLKEKQYSDFEPVKEPFSASLRTVLGDSYFKHYLIADLMYRISSTFTITGFTYYITVLLGLPKTLVSFYLLLIFFTNLILYLPVAFIANKIGKRKILFISFLLLMFFLIASSFAGRYPFEDHSQGVFLTILVSIPISIFTVVPNALVADLVVASRRKTGKQRGGLYFGVYSLVSKAGEFIAFILFPIIVSIDITKKESLVPLSKNIFGLRLSLIIAAIISLTGFLTLFGFREKEIQVLLEE